MRIYNEDGYNLIAIHIDTFIDENPCTKLCKTKRVGSNSSYICYKMCHLGTMGSRSASPCGQNGYVLSKVRGY